MHGPVHPTQDVNHSFVQHIMLRMCGPLGLINLVGAALLIVTEVSPFAACIRVRLILHDKIFILHDNMLSINFIAVFCSMLCVITLFYCTLTIN